MFGDVSYVSYVSVKQKDLELVSAAINGLDEKQWQRGMTLMCIWDSKLPRVQFTDHCSYVSRISGA